MIPGMILYSGICRLISNSEIEAHPESGLQNLIDALKIGTAEIQIF